MTKLPEAVTKADVRRFKLSANSATASGDGARHAVDSGEPLKNSMSLKEAEGVVRRLLAKWFDEKGTEGRVGLGDSAT